MSKKFISLKEAAEDLNLRNGTLRQYLKRDKIRSTKDEKGRHMITKKEVERYKKEKNLIEEEIKDYFSIKQLEMLGIPKEIVISGEIESKIVEGKYYVHYKESKRYLKEKPRLNLISTQCEQTIIVRNRGGLHFRPIAKIIEIGESYLKMGLALKITYNGKDWLFPSMGTAELLSLCVHRGESVLVYTEGPGAMLCMSDLTKAFKEGFCVKY